MSDIEHQPAGFEDLAAAREHAKRSLAAFAAAETAKIDALFATFRQGLIQLIEQVAEADCRAMTALGQHGLVLLAHTFADEGQPCLRKQSSALGSDQSKAAQSVNLRLQIFQTLLDILRHGLPSGDDTASNSPAGASAHGQIGAGQ